MASRATALTAVLSQEVFHHFIHDIDLVAPRFIDDDPGTALKGAIEIGLDFQLKLGQNRGWIFFVFRQGVPPQSFLLPAKRMAPMALPTS